MLRLLKLLVAAACVAVLIGVACIWIMPKQATDFAIHAERVRAGLTQHEVTLDHGLKIVYLEGGTGEPLVLIHGFSANKDNFTRIAGKLTAHYHVIIPDLIGFGESSHPMDADYHFAAQAERLHQFIGLLNLSTVDIGGSSMGGGIATTYAALYPNNTKSLWLLDTAGVSSAPPTSIFSMYLKTGQHPLLIDRPEQYAMVFEKTMSNPPFVPTPMQHVMAQESIDNKPLLQRILPQIASDSIESHAKTLKIPTLIVWGEQDQLLDVRSADILHRLIAGSQVITMPNIGHLPMLEDVNQTAQDYLAFRAAH